MKRATETRPGSNRLAFLALALVALSGCDEALETAEKSEDQPAANEIFPQATNVSQRDIEAPDVFQVTEAGLWDGRPSLGGVWVAHPDVTQPQRVLIKNTANSTSITGALFRRERNLPGPALQVSSAAAEQLGLLAGAPTRLDVVALKREEVVTPPVVPAPDPAAQDVSDTETTIAQADADPQSETATASADPEKPAKRKWWQKKEPATAAVAAGAVAAGAATATAAANDVTADGADIVADAVEETAPEPEKPAKRKWWQKKEPATAPATSTAAAEAAPEPAAVDTVDAVTETAAVTAAAPALSDAPVVAPAEKPAKRKWWQKKDPDEITQTPLDPIAGAAAAIEASEPVPAAATAPASTIELSKPFVQIGTFGVQANADSAAAQVRRNGMSAEVRELKTEDSTVWRVLVGPAANRAERKAIRNDVRDLGFTDAFTVSN
ncbi:MAG: SPOR domain-containing protein [Pseudomonadota bacterium]